MDAYSRWLETRTKIENMTPEERLRWELKNECSCRVVEYWWNPIEHYGSCPLENPENEMWIFYESPEEGFLIPESTGK